jgi:hypothetical protein
VTEEGTAGEHGVDHPTPSRSPSSHRARAYVAWAEWNGWRGPPELVAQIARAGLWALAGTHPPTQDATCSIELEVDDDVERFADPKDFREQATADGLRRFSQLDLRMRLKDDDVHVCLSPINVKRGRPGVVLLATATDERRAVALRDGVAASISRRAGRNHQHRGQIERSSRLREYELLDWPSRAARRVSVGVPETPTLEHTSPRGARRFSDLEDETWGSARWARITRWATSKWRGVVDPFATDEQLAAILEHDGLDPRPLGPATPWARRIWQALLSVWAFAFLLALTGEPDSETTAGWGSAVVLGCAALGAAGYAMDRWLRPRVEVTSANRLQRFLSVAGKGVLAAAVSGAIGKSIELLIGG